MEDKPETRYFAVLPNGASGVRVARLEDGRFQFDGDSHSFGLAPQVNTVPSREIPVFLFISNRGKTLYYRW